ncbi:MAG: VOC family protein [Pseudomonadales bacterium]|nr:VOC family protein [Pseudomonadales bacterium]
MHVSGTRCITVGVSNLDRALGLFAQVMALSIDWRGALDASWLRTWGRPAGTQAQAAELSCNGYPYGRLRLVEFSPLDATRVRDDFGANAPDSPLDIGPKAIDFYVADPIAPIIARVVKAGYPARSAPRKHQIGQTISEEVVVSGPDDVPVLLMVGHRHARTSLRAGSPDGLFSEIATASVICGDLDASRQFYEEQLGLVAVTDAETPDEYRTLVDELVDVPAGTRVHFLLYAERGEASGKILLIHFFDAQAKRLVGRMQPGHLGFSLFSHDVDDLRGLHARLENSGTATVELPPTRATTPNGARLVMLVRGPNEELFEFSAAA